MTDYIDYHPPRPISLSYYLAKSDREHELEKALNVHNFRKKPIVIKAIQYTGKNIDDLLIWAGANNVRLEEETEPYIYIQTLEGSVMAAPGDWIIRGVSGEYYPCKPDIFAATYEPEEGQ